MKFFDGVDFIRADMLQDTGVALSFRARYYSIEYIHSGAILLRLDGKEFYHEAPCVFHTFPGVLVEYDTGGGRLLRTHYWTVFQGTKVPQYLDGELLRIDLEKPFKEIQNPDHFAAMIQNLNMLINTAQHDKAVLHLEHLLFYLCEQEVSGTRKSSFHTEKLKKLLVGIARTPQEEWNFEKEAVRMNITRNHFNRLFRQTAGTSPRQFVIHSRLQKAAEMLFSTTMSVKEIASLVGLENEFYFSRLFKKKYSQSPSDYRRECSALEPIGKTIRKTR